MCVCVCVSRPRRAWCPSPCLLQTNTLIKPAGCCRATEETFSSEAIIIKQKARTEVMSFIWLRPKSLNHSLTRLKKKKKSFNFRNSINERIMSLHYSYSQTNGIMNTLWPLLLILQRRLKLPNCAARWTLTVDEQLRWDWDCHSCGRTCCGYTLSTVSFLPQPDTTGPDKPLSAGAACHNSQSDCVFFPSRQKSASLQLLTVERDWICLY